MRMPWITIALIRPGRLAAAAVSVSILVVAVGCGGSDPTSLPTSTPTLPFLEVGTPTSLAVSPLRAEMWDERQGGTLIFGSAKEMTSPHPWTTTISVDQAIKESTMLEPLVQLAVDGSLIPVLATSWVANDDASVWTFHLRQGVKFHNGQEMTSADVVWDVNYIMDPENAARGHDDFSPTVASVQAVDKYTVRFNMLGSQPVFPLIVSDISVMSIIPANSLERGEIQVSETPPGTGPFKFEAWVPGDRTEVVRFDDYWGGKPYLEKIVFKLISSSTGRANALRTKEIQLAERLGPIFAGRVLSGDVGGLEVSPATLSGYKRIAFNVESPLFRDRDLRLAAIYAMDMQKLLDEAYFGLGTLISMPVPPGSVWDEVLRECCPRRAGDVNKAKELLAASSYDGTPVQLLVGRGQGQPLGESLGRQLREAGFTVDLQILEQGIYEERQIVGDFDINSRGGGWTGDPVLYGAGGWHCGEGDRRLSNPVRFCDPELDRLSAAYVGLESLDERLAAFRQIATRIYDAAYTKDMGWHYDRLFGWINDLKGFEHRGGGDYTRHPVGGGLWRVYFER